MRAAKSTARAEKVAVEADDTQSDSAQAPAYPILIEPQRAAMEEVAVATPPVMELEVEAVTAVSTVPLENVQAVEIKVR